MRKVRLAHGTDAEAIFSLINDNAKPGELRSISMRELEAAISIACIMVAIGDDGDVVGTIRNIWHDPENLADERVVELASLVVRKDYRGDGLGLHLIKAGRILARHMGTQKYTIGFTRRPDVYAHLGYKVRPFEWFKKTVGRDIPYDSALLSGCMMVVRAG